MKRPYITICAIAFCCCIIFSSCKKHLENSPSWDTSILAPLLKSTLSLDDLLADSLLQTNADHTVSLIFNSDLYHASLKDATIEIPDTTLNIGFSLGTIDLANQSIVYNYTLGAMCMQLGLAGIFIILNNGSPYPVPEITGISAGETEIDATQFFESADIESGFIDITLQNGLPLTMTSMVFQVRNKNDQQVLTQDTFLNLLPNQSQTKVIDLSGKHVEGTLIGTLLELTSPGGTVNIDTSDAITITMVAHDIRVSSATAVFPAQNLIDDNKLTTYKLSGGAALNELRMKSGSLTIHLTSTIPQKSHFEYSLPSAKDISGNFIQLNQDLPAAPPGGTSTASQSFDLSGFTFDLRGPDGTLHNTFYSHLVASIDSTGDIVTISKNDSILIEYELKDMVPDYISGYVGQQIVNVGPEETAFDIFKSIHGGTLALEDVKVDLSIENGLGVQGRINIYNLSSINSTTGHEVPLTWTLLNTPLNIQPATDNPLTPSEVT